MLRDVDTRDTKIYQTEVQVRHNQNSDKQMQMNVSIFTTNEDLWSPGVDLNIPENQSDSNYERKNLLAFYQVKPAKEFFTSIGFEVIRENGGSQGLLDFGGFTVVTEFDLTRNSSAYFIEGKYHVNKDTVWSAGLREDKAEGFENNISPQISFQYKHGAGHYNFGLGRGFKLPSFFALGHPLVGNPDFKPETSEAFDVSAKYQISPKLSYNAALFYNTFYNLIDFGDSGVLVSRDEVIIRGLELGVDRNISENVFLKAFYSAMDMDIKNSSEVLHKRPERSAGVQVNWKVTSQLNTFLKANYIGNVHDFSYPTGEIVLNSYIRTDVAVLWGFSMGLQGSVAIDNVLNEKYYESVGNEASGAILRVAIKGSL